MNLPQNINSNKLSACLDFLNVLCKKAEESTCNVNRECSSCLLPVLKDLIYYIDTDRLYYKIPFDEVISIYSFNFRQNEPVFMDLLANSYSLFLLSCKLCSRSSLHDCCPINIGIASIHYFMSDEKSSVPSYVETWKKRTSNNLFHDLESLNPDFKKMLVSKFKKFYLAYS